MLTRCLHCAGAAALATGLLDAAAWPLPRQPVVPAVTPSRAPPHDSRHRNPNPAHGSHHRTPNPAHGSISMSTLHHRFYNPEPRLPAPHHPYAVPNGSAHVQLQPGQLDPGPVGAHPLDVYIFCPVLCSAALTHSAIFFSRSGKTLSHAIRNSSYVNHPAYGSFRPRSEIVRCLRLCQGHALGRGKVPDAESVGSPAKLLQEGQRLLNSWSRRPCARARPRPGILLSSTRCARTGTGGSSSCCTRSSPSTSLTLDARRRQGSGDVRRWCR